MVVSIITVVYNNEHTLEQAITSVLSQTYKNIEYIIVDGGSKDGTIDIIKKYDNKISRWISEKDNGLYDAMNKGVQLATGDIIGILNSDDLYQDINVIADVVKCFGSNTELDMVYGDLLYVKALDTNHTVRKWKSTSYFDHYFENGNVPPHPALFLKAKVYRAAGLFNLKYRLAADYEFMLRVFKKYHFKSEYMNRIMVKMRLGGATNKSIKNIINQNREILDAWKENGIKAPFTLMLFRIFKRIVQFL